MTTHRPHRWLLMVPFVWQAALVPWSNDVQWRPLGLPFPMAWQMAGILVTSIVLWVVYRRDQAAALAEKSAEKSAESSAESLADANDRKVVQ